jgi:predicted metal-dependent hydrolase
MAQRALLFRRSEENPSIKVVFDGETFRIQLKRMRQARRYTLRVQHTTREVVLTMPLRGDPDHAADFAKRHGGWIAARLGRLPEVVPFEHGAEIPIRGVLHRISHRPGSRGTVWTEESPSGRPLICVAGEAEHLTRRLTDWLKREAKKDLEKASRKYAGELGATITRITVRDQSTRWGSCSASGALSYSWRLIFAPRHVLAYLAAHECCHLIEMNHSRRFWRLVEKLDPDMDRAKAWLRAHGAELHRYGATA